MQSVGEVMAIGRTFRESFAKALRSRELDSPARVPRRRRGAARARSRRPARSASTRCSRPSAAASSVEAVHERCLVDRWFLRELEALALEGDGTDGLARAYKSVDTCAAEFEAATPYYYSAHERPRPDGSAASEVRRGDRDSIVILGAGPNRIGQGIEFDYCCVHAAMTARELGRDAVMVNCNPETVSTDYDTSDRLYFEPLTAEDVLAVCEQEQPRGRDRPVRRPDAAEARPRARGGGRAAARHAGRRDRPRRGPRPLRRPAAQARHRAPALRDGALGRGGGGDRRGGRLPAAGPALLRARRPGDGDLLLDRGPRRLPGGQRQGRPGAPAAARPLPRERDRGRRRRARRRRVASTSPGSCSTSRRPASTPATRPACSRR